MPYQYDKLRGRIIEKYGTQGNFAKALGLSSNSVSKKLNCRTGFTQEEMGTAQQRTSSDKGKARRYIQAICKAAQ